MTIGGVIELVPPIANTYALDEWENASERLRATEDIEAPVCLGGQGLAIA